jgi:hypothetical protein
MTVAFGENASERTMCYIITSNASLQRGTHSIALRAAVSELRASLLVSQPKRGTEKTSETN